MRLILDSNVLVAAVASRGACAELLVHVLERHAFAVDDNLLGEVERILQVKLKVPVDRITPFLGLLRGTATHLDPPPLPVPACRDPDDDRVLALARAFDAHALITGDNDLLVLDPWGDLRIVSPRDFWSFEAGVR